MNPAPGAGSEGTKKMKRRRRPARRSLHQQDPNAPLTDVAPKNPNAPRPTKPVRQYAKRVDEVSAGGLVIDLSGTRGLLIGRLDVKDSSRERLLWSLPKGHIEEGESPEEAAKREVKEETGIEGEIARSLGIIDFWFMAGGKRIHKTVHHFLFREKGGALAPQVTEVDEVAWFPLTEIIEHLAYPDEKKLIARSGELSP